MGGKLGRVLVQEPRQAEVGVGKGVDRGQFREALKGIECNRKVMLGTHHQLEGGPELFKGQIGFASCG